MTWEGIDVSAFNAVLSSATLKGKSFVIARAGDGLTKDSAYTAQIKAAKGKTLGAYWRQAAGIDAKAQADLLLSTVGDPTDRLLALDWEAPPGGSAPSVADAKSFLAHVQGKGWKIGLYCSISQWQDLGQDWNWIAHPGSEPTIPHDIWQYQAVAGIGDYDKAFTDPDTLKAGGGSMDQATFNDMLKTALGGLGTSRFTELTTAVGIARRYNNESRPTDAEQAKGWDLADAVLSGGTPVPAPGGPVADHGHAAGGVTTP